MRDTTLAYVSRAPLEKLERYKAKRGWTFPWYSSFGSDFNVDFGVTVDESVAPAAYNYKTREEHEAAGTGYYFEGEQPIEQPGVSCFLRVDDRVFHTYSSFGRGGGVDRRLLRLPGSHGARPPGGLGGAARPLGERPRGRPELPDLTYWGTCSPNAPASRSAAVCSSL